MNWLPIWTAGARRVAVRLAAAAVRPSRFGEVWDLDADRRREMHDLEAIRVRFPDHA